MEAFLKIEGHSWRMASLAFMAPRLSHLHQVLKETGSFYRHCDAKRAHALKVMRDSIFGYGHFRNEHLWHYTNKLRRKHKRV